MLVVYPLECTTLILITCLISGLLHPGNVCIAEDGNLVLCCENVSLCGGDVLQGGPRSGPEPEHARFTAALREEMCASCRQGGEEACDCEATVDIYSFGVICAIILSPLFLEHFEGDPSSAFGRACAGETLALRRGRR